MFCIVMRVRISPRLLAALASITTQSVLPPSSPLLMALTSLYRSFQSSDQKRESDSDHAWTESLIRSDGFCIYAFEQSELRTYTNLILPHFIQLMPIRRKIKLQSSTCDSARDIFLRFNLCCLAIISCYDWCFHEKDNMGVSERVERILTLL